MKKRLTQRRFGITHLELSLATLALAVGFGFQSLGVAADGAPPSNAERKAAQASFAGRFHGPDVQMRFKPDGVAWTGTILFKSQTYRVQAALHTGMLEGTFGDGQQAWPFSISGEGDKLSFTAGSFNTALQRQALPPSQGVYRSRRVELEFLNKDGGTNGLITYQGQQFRFTASEVAGDLEGSFQSGAETFQFSLVPENKGWVFKTGKFSDVLSLPEEARLADQQREDAPVAARQERGSSAGEQDANEPSPVASVPRVSSSDGDYQQDQKRQEEFRQERQEEFRRSTEENLRRQRQEDARREEQRRREHQQTIDSIDKARAEMNREAEQRRQQQQAEQRQRDMQRKFGQKY